MSASHDILRDDQATVKNMDFVQFSDDRSRLTSRGGNGTVFIWAIPFDADDAEMMQYVACPREEDSNADGISNPSTLPHLLSQSNPEDVVVSFCRNMPKNLWNVSECASEWLRQTNQQNSPVRFNPKGTLKVNGFLREAITISRLRNTNGN